MVKNADRIICTSNTYLKHSAALRQWKKKCHVVPLGLDPDRLNSDGKIEAAEKDKSSLTVLSIGRFTYYKGFEYLVTAAEKVPDTDFIIVGDGPEYSNIKTQVDKKKLNNRVFLPGKVSRNELIHLFGHCDIFCLPSLERTEAFGLVLLEAMYFSIPLITTTIKGSGVNEVNQHETTGLQVPVANADAIAEAIFSLKKNTEKRKETGRQARKRFDSFFHIQPVAERITRLYDYVFSRRNCTRHLL
ncbi:MAG: glycosyltransferase [Desulfobacterales bacterium]|nr:glycosyltransferase [Desulfobacterales bacterium]